MIVYNVTTKIDDSVHEEWLQWMKSIHIPDVMKTGYFIENRMLKVLGEGEEYKNTYSIQYTCRAMKDFLEYEVHKAPALRKEHNDKYGNKFVSFRTLLEVVE